jgi:NAD(P)-dependent dehydrogenase (short-subunit alcohol dehydrogenase family)
MPRVTLKPVDEQVVVIFGASSGIGRMTALQFANEGAKVMLAGRKEDALRTLVDTIRASGGHASYCMADAANFVEVKQVAEQTIDRFGRIDTWAHIAGVGAYARFEDMTPEEFEQCVRVNLLGQAYGAMAALPYLKRQGGALIHVSSVEAEVSLPFQSAYAAAKHGVKGFIDSLRLELEHDEIPVSVTNIMPAVINTPFFNNAYTKLGVKPKGMPPFYEPEDVAEAIVSAAEEPQRDVIVGGSGLLYVWGKRLMPRLMDIIMLQTAFKGQLSRQPKSPYDPSNLVRSDQAEARIHA